MNGRQLLIAAAMLCACFMGLYACSSPSNTGSNTDSQDSAPAPTSASTQSSTEATINPESPSTAEKPTSSSGAVDNHIDDFTIVNVVRGEDNAYGYWEMEVTVQNNTDEEKNFLGFQIDELNADGNIINSYMSYNKNASETIVEPGQQYTITLTEKSDDGIAGMQSRYCEWGEHGGDRVKCEYSEKYKIMF